MIPEKIKESAIADYIAGELSVAQICKKYAIGSNTLYKLIPKELKRGYPSIAEEIKQSAVSDYIAGELSVAQICKKYNIERTTLNKLIPKELKNRKHIISEETKRSVIADYIAGELTYVQICEKYNISNFSLSKWLPKDLKRGSRPTSKISEETKQSAIADYIAGELTRIQICVKHNIGIDTLDKLIPKELKRGSRPTHRISEETKQSAIADYIAGELTRIQICEKYNIGITTLDNLIPKDLKRNRTLKISEETKQSAIADYIAGELSVAQICEKYNICIKTLDKLIPKELKRGRGPTPRISEETKQSAIADYIAGKLTRIQICEKYNIGIDTLDKLIPKDLKRSRGRTLKLSEETKQSVMADYIAGELTRIQICEKYNIGIKTLDKLIPKELKRGSGRIPRISEETKQSVIAD